MSPDTFHVQYNFESNFLFLFLLVEKLNRFLLWLQKVTIVYIEVLIETMRTFYLIKTLSETKFRFCGQTLARSHNIILFPKLL